jgi:hypothetical protein
MKVVFQSLIDFKMKIADRSQMREVPGRSDKWIIYQKDDERPAQTVS